MALGVFEQVPYQAAHESGVTGQLHGVGIKIDAGIDARTFLGHQPCEIHVLLDADGIISAIQTTRQQNLVDQLIEFGDIMYKLGANGRSPFDHQQLDGHADARQWRTQFMRSVSQ